MGPILSVGEIMSAFQSVAVIAMAPWQQESVAN
jgi:hypothetical protein